MTRDELIAALEQAKEGSAELDREMFAALHGRPLGERETYVPYTRSVDAALAALPAGGRWTMNGGERSHATVSIPRAIPDRTGARFINGIGEIAATPSPRPLRRHSEGP